MTYSGWMKRDTSIVRVGTGAGFSDDRWEPARDLAERGDVDYLVFECLAERTIARETLSKLKNPEAGYTPYLVERFEAVLPACRRVVGQGAEEAGGGAMRVSTPFPPNAARSTTGGWLTLTRSCRP